MNGQQRTGKRVLVVAMLCACLAAGRQANALPPALKERAGKDYFVAAKGSPTGNGSRQSPWDIQSTFTGKHVIEPGSVVWLAEGTYRCPARTEQGSFVLTGLRGTKDRPIHISAAPGKRVILDGGLTVSGDLSYVWLWNLEIIVSENFTASRDSNSTADMNRPIGGLNILSGNECKYINLYIHDNTSNGVGFWVPARNSEIYGCIIAANGYRGTDRGHGHCVYTQNDEEGLKTISNCIMWVHKDFGCFSMHAYTEGSKVMNFLIEQNIAYHGGAPKQAPFLIGGGKYPVKNIRVERNLLYGCRGIEIGPYTKVDRNVDCHVTGNFVVGGSITIRKYQVAEVATNAVYRGNIDVNQVDDYQQGENRATWLVPERPDVFVLPNKYDPDRAHLVIYNWKKQDRVQVDLSQFMTAGRFELRDPCRFWEKPVFEGECRSGAAVVPMRNEEFAAFVVLREQQPGDEGVKQDAPTPKRTVPEDEKLLTLARNYLLNGAKDKARECLKKLLEEFPDSQHAEKARQMIANLEN